MPTRALHSTLRRHLPVTPPPWVLLSVAILGCAPPAIVEQDVSFLVPLDQARTFLAASASGGDGAALLDRALFDRLHPLTVTDEPDALYAALSTVAVRFDACFTEGRGEPPCRPQVRLVLQPVFDSADGVTTRDAAVHLFFSVTTEELDAAVRALSIERTRLGEQVGSALAGSHPGFNHARWVERARAVLLPLLKKDRVVRATVMSVHASNEAWIFAGVEVDQGAFTDIVLPTLAPAHEAHVTSTGGVQKLAVSLDPPSSEESALARVLDPLLREKATTAELDEGARALERLEDPAAHNPGTVDCAACHVAATAKWFLSNQLSIAVAGPPPSTEAYSDSRSLRAFGYFFKAPAISPRVVRETSAVRADFARRLDP